jgi:hypothetical protein
MIEAKKLTILNLIKAQVTPQFNWYTCWTSLGANGMPDKLIKEGLKQPVIGHGIGGKVIPAKMA